MGPFSKPEIAPMIAGEPVQLERLEALSLQEKFSKEEFERLREKYGELRQLMEDTFKKARDIKKRSCGRNSPTWRRSSAGRSSPTRSTT